MSKRSVVLIAFVLALMHVHAQPAKAQNKAKGPDPKKVGVKVKENFACVLANNPNAFHSVPVPTAYVLLYRYRSAAGASDNSDSIALLNTIIADLAPLTKSYGLYLECMSFNPVPSRNQECLIDISEKSKWINKSNKTDEYFAIYPVVINNQKTPSSILNAGKLTLIGPDGTVLAIASSLGNFHYDPLAAKPENIKGKLLTADKVKQPVQNASVYLVSNNDTLSQAKTDRYGDFELSGSGSYNNTVLKVVPVEKNLSALILATQEGREISQLRKTASGFEYKFIQADIIKLTDMAVSDDISASFKKFAGSGQKELKQIENIDYGLSKYEVSEEAKSVLNKIVMLMNENPGVKLEIISHTDAQGDDASNMELSAKRANAVADFLVSKGIARTRLTATGKGESAIRNRCVNTIDCSEREHRYNRRTEFRFIKT